MQKNDRINECKCCGKEKYIQNKFLQYCAECIYKRNHKGKTKVEVAKKPKVVKKTGEKTMFIEIWNEREHICENCKKYLGELPKAYMFAHIVPKSVDNKNRLNKENVRLLCWDCHDALDKQSRDNYEKRRNINTQEDHR